MWTSHVPVEDIPHPALCDNKPSATDFSRLFVYRVDVYRNAAGAQSFTIFADSLDRRGPGIMADYRHENSVLPRSQLKRAAEQHQPAEMVLREPEKVQFEIRGCI